MISNSTCLEKTQMHHNTNIFLHIYHVVLLNLLQLNYIQKRNRKDLHFATPGRWHMISDKVSPVDHQSQ